MGDKIKELDSIGSIITNHKGICPIEINCDMGLIASSITTEVSDALAEEINSQYGENTAEIIKLKK